MAAYLAILFLPDLVSGSADTPGFAAPWTTWFALWFPWLPLVWLVRLVVRRHAIGARRFLPVHLGAFTLVLIMHLGAAIGILRLVAGVGPVTIGLAHDLLFDKGVLLLDVLIYGTLLMTWNWRLLHGRLREKRHDALLLGKHLTESRLQTLKMQLNPHFLFNTLNSVSVLVEKNDTRQAQEMIGQLSGFLRQTLGNSSEKWATLATELDMVRRYVAIEKVRFGPRLSFHEECEPLALEARIPPMLLQPLFENAIVHGLADKEGACRLNFECRVHDRRLFMLISDNGAGFDATRDPRHGAGIGLANVEARLREVYGEDYSLHLERAYPQGTLVSLRIPAYKDSMHRRQSA